MGPEGAGEGEVGAEVEQGLLAHLAVLADEADEAVAVAGLAADEVGPGGPDEHEDKGGRVGGRKQANPAHPQKTWHYIGLSRAETHNLETPHKFQKNM